MEELFYNYTDHIGHMISPKLGSEINNYLKDNLGRSNDQNAYRNIENDIKIIMANYFQNANDQEYIDIATNWFNSYVENDDENLIKAVKFFIRIYGYWQGILLKKKFNKWRLNALKSKLCCGGLNNKKENNINGNCNANVNANRRNGRDEEKRNYDRESRYKKNQGINYTGK